MLILIQILCFTMHMVGNRENQELPLVELVIKMQRLTTINLTQRQNLKGGSHFTFTIKIIRVNHNHQITTRNYQNFRELT